MPQLFRPSPRRRRGLLLSAACAALLLPALAAAPAATPARTLRQAAGRDALLVGAAVNPFLLGHSRYSTALARQYNLIEAENAMKWPITEPALNHFDFRGGDQIVAFAAAHHMLVRGHNLLWNKQNPAWLVHGHFTPAQLAGIVHTHIQTVMRHYAGKVFAWDVINEAFDKTGAIKHSYWYDQPGIGDSGHGLRAMERVFRWAHAADPNALLFYNDYNVAAINAKSNAMYAMVRRFQRDGVPIDGVGFQLHLRNLNPSSLATLSANIARFGALGIQVHITELDVALPINQQRQLINRNELQKQAAMYRTVAAACARQPACTALQTWGFTDRYSWIPGYTHGKFGFALPLDREYQPKPAFHAMMQALVAAPAGIAGKRRAIAGSKEAIQ